jgi:hypothetical protein
MSAAQAVAATFTATPAPRFSSLTVSPRNFSLAGRRVNARCVKQTHKNRKHRRCTRPVALPGTLTLTGKQGTDTFTFNGRLGGHRLGPGSYQLTATPTASGAVGSPRATAFTITT